MRTPAVLCFATVIATGLSYYDAHDRFLWFLEAAPVLIGLVILCATYPFYVFSNFTYAVIFVGFMLMLIGAHYTYAHVPLFNWLKGELGWTRNHYDRFGHFFQGVVPAIILREMLIRAGFVKPLFLMSSVVLLSCIGISALYEILEMIAAFLVTGSTIEWFLGFQGDAWDTQKDMCMATGGALLALILFPRWHDASLQRLRGLPCN